MVCSAILNAELLFKGKEIFVYPPVRAWQVAGRSLEETFLLGYALDYGRAGADSAIC